MGMKTVSLVYENGVFRPLEPVDLEEGHVVELTIREAERPQHERLKLLLEQWAAEPQQESEAWWDEFRAFLKENRLHFAERDIDWGDE